MLIFVTILHTIMCLILIGIVLLKQVRTVWERPLAAQATLFSAEQAGKLSE